MRSIELFAGGGGLALGLHEAGFEPTLVVERDTDSCSTLRENWTSGLCTKSLILNRDIRTVEFDNWIDNVDVVSGGPPCQPFSIGGKHKGHAVETHYLDRAEWRHRSCLLSGVSAGPKCR